MKYFFRALIICMSLVLGLAHPLVCEAQEPSDTLSVYFHRDSHKFDPEWKDNGRRCDEFINRIIELQKKSSVEIRRVEFVSGASPEGRTRYNEALSRRRCESVASYLHSKLSFQDSTLFINSIPEDWKGLEQLVIEDDKVPDKEEVLSIMRTYEGDKCDKALIELKNGEAWKYMLENLFPKLRRFRVLVYVGIELPEIEDIEVEECPLEEKTIDWGETATPSFHFEYVPEWQRQLTLKTNTIGWALSGANIEVEVDLCKHLSISVPFHYSGGLDYFKETIKFRGIVLQPGLRYYPKLSTDKKNNGFFVGAHFGMGWYNFALNGDYRIQDHAGKSPALGGGIGLGYSMQFKKNPRWGMEFAIGGGVYSVYYDTFFNENNGPYNERATKDVWFGIDNAAVSFTYSFDLVKKGGNK